MPIEQQVDTSAPLIEQQNQSQARKKRLIIIAASIVVSVIILVVVITVLLLTLRGGGSGSGNSCKPTEVPPFIRSHLIKRNSIKPIPSQDNLALVRFAGYLKLLDENADDSVTIKYLELELQKVHHQVMDDGHIRLRLHTACVTLDIRVHKYPNMYKIGEFIIKSNSSDSHFEDCLTANEGTQISLDRYYRCYRSEFYPCTNLSRNDITLGGRRIDQAGMESYVLELEIDGDPDKIVLGHFSKKPEDC